MTYQIVLKEEAVADISEAYHYYENQSKGLGERFLAELEASYSSLATHPSNFGFIDNQKILRDKKVSVFPFNIIYFIEENSVVILAVHHSKKHPSKRYR
jgi:toxin ParE1/3/4